MEGEKKGWLPTPIAWAILIGAFIVGWWLSGLLIR